MNRDVCEHFTPVDLECDRCFIQELDRLWNVAMRVSMAADEQYTRYRFAELVAAAEREACAKVCDDKHNTWRWDNEPDSASGPRDCAAAIRTRGNK